MSLNFILHKKTTYYYDEKIQNGEMGQACSMHEEIKMRYAYVVLVETPEGKR
jgi:hypothetical protein